MLTSTDLYKKYGHPAKKKNMVFWDVPTELEIGLIPKKIYCNADLIPVLTIAFKSLIDTGCISELKTWDGCWNFRPVRGYENKYQSLMDAGKEDQAIKYLSIHSWGCAIDINAGENPLGVKGKFTKKFVKCFTDAGMNWGGNFQNRVDPMHFELALLPF